MTDQVRETWRMQDHDWLDERFEVMAEGPSSKIELVEDPGRHIGRLELTILDA